jgi:hypothetical protein
LYLGRGRHIAVDNSVELHGTVHFTTQTYSLCLGIVSHIAVDNSVELLGTVHFTTQIYSLYLGTGRYITVDNSVELHGTVNFTTQLLEAVLCVVPVLVFHLCDSMGRYREGSAKRSFLIFNAKT